MSSPWPDDHPIKRNENVFGFSLSAGAFEILQFLSLVIAPSGLSNPGAQLYHFVTGNLAVCRDGCKAACAFPSLTAKGDCTDLVVTGCHAAAAKAREDRRRLSRTWRQRIHRWFYWQ